VLNSLSVMQNANDTGEALGLGWLPEDVPADARVTPVYAAGALPTDFDWRSNSGANWMTSVKNQGGCGSCVAFGAVGATEAQYRIAANSPGWDVDLSEQHLFSCGGGQCGYGWYISAALNRLRDYGTPDEACFPYAAQDRSCSGGCADWQSRAFEIASWSWVANNPSALEAALMNGPLVAGFTVYRDFYAYHGGVYHWDHVSQAVGGHAIVIVGYDSNEQYWIVKNSWGSYWGEGGYFRIGFGEAGIENYVASIRASFTPPTYTVTFYADPTSGTTNAEGVTKSNGATGSYTANQRVHVLANPPEGYRFSYWETSSVSVDNQLSQDTYMTVPNAGSLEARFATLPSGSSVSFFHPYTEFWFSQYDMLNAEWDAIHIVNVGTGTASIHVTIGNPPQVTDSVSLETGKATYRTYPGVAGGPVRITSDQSIWVTQRILGWTAMQEIYGAPGDVASADIVFTWYDLVGAAKDDIYVVNPSGSETASVDLYVASDLRGHLDVQPGQAAATNFPGVVGGPLRVRSSIPVFASQRVVGFGDFTEIIGLPSWYTFTETWFTWYDMRSASWDAIHFLNPGGDTATVSIFIAGTLRGTVSLAQGAADFATFPGVVGGPVRIVSDQPIWVTQRIIGWNGWKEVFGVPTTLATTSWYFTWYDMKGASWDAIHLLNPGGTDANVQIYIAGKARQSMKVSSGGAAYATYPGEMNGPIVIVSDQPIIVSQRIVGWSSFEETIGAQWS